MGTDSPLDNAQRVSLTNVTGEARSPSDLSIGYVLGGRFRIDGDIGEGGMGKVFEATDLEAGDSVAVKVLNTKGSLSEDARARFRREAEILAGLDHPGIVRLRASGDSDDGHLWMAMERLRGETLRDHVDRLGPMKLSQLAPILDAACDALQVAHEHGVIHRDLKPDNIYLTNDPSWPVKLLDFGLSQHRGSAKLTQTGTVLGTPRYMSPEQIASAHQADARTDVYALGIIVYESLAGKSPFVASDQGQLLGAIVTGRKEPLENLRNDLSPALVAVVDKATAHRVEERYQSARDFATAFAAATGVHDSERPSLRMHRSAIVRRGRHPALLFGLGFVAGLVLFGALGALLAHLLD